MRTAAAITIAIWWNSHGQAQTTFAKIYDGGTAFKFNLTEMPNQNILVGLGRTRAVSHVDIGNGGITFTHSYWAHPTELISGFGGIHRYSDDVYVFTAGYKMTLDTCTGPYVRYHPVIGKFNAEGGLLDLRRYDLNDGCRNTGSDVIVTADRGLVVWGHEESFLVLKVDSTLEPLWAKRFATQGGFRFIRELPDGDLLAGFDMDTAGACVARLDANGDFLWCKSYMRPMGRMHDAVISPDSSFIIMGYTGGTPQKLFMMKLDGEGDVQWCRGYDNGFDAWASLYPSRMVHTLDGQLAVLATLGQQQFPYFHRPFLMKVDMNGDTLWTRSTGANAMEYNTQDLLAHSDGGFAISGSVWGSLPGGNMGLPYIFKTDSSGHFSCHEHHQTVEVLDLFPIDSSFMLTSVDGATMHPAFVSDTIFDPIAVYNACNLGGGTGLPPSAGLPQRMNIRPNPNTGRFTMAFKDPLLAESWYSVYDAMGKLLFQRPLQPGKETEEIDLSRYGKGTYVIKCTDPEGVYHERVVVE